MFCLFLRLVNYGIGDRECSSLTHQVSQQHKQPTQEISTGALAEWPEHWPSSSTVGSGCPHSTSSPSVHHIRHAKRSRHDGNKDAHWVCSSVGQTVIGEEGSVKTPDNSPGGLWVAEEFIQTLRLPPLRWRERAVPLVSLVPQCCWLFLLHQHLHFNKYVALFYLILPCVFLPWNKYSNCMLSRSGSWSCDWQIWGL